MAWIRSHKKGSGGGGGVSILSGATEPTSSQGTNGQLYFQTAKGTKQSFGSFNYIKENSMRVAISIENVTFTYTGGQTIGAQAYEQFDLTDVDTIKITVKTSTPTYNNYQTERFSPILLIENTINPASAYPANSSIVSANGETYRVTTVGDTVTFEADVSELTGNYWVVLSSIGCTTVWSDMYLLSDSADDLVCDTFVKVNGAWQDLISSDIDDVNLGN